MNHHLIRVFEIPPPDPRYCFGDGKLMPFREVDWFMDSLVHPSLQEDDLAKHSITTEPGRLFLTDFIRQKRYYRPGVPLLVLHPQVSFTIGYEAT